MIIGITVVSFIILNGIISALLFSSFQPISIFRGLNALRLRDGILRKSLVVVQFSFSICLIIGTIVIYQQMKFVREKDPGYDRGFVFSSSLPIKWMIRQDNAKRE